MAADQVEGWCGHRAPEACPQPPHGEGALPHGGRDRDLPVHRAGPPLPQRAQAASRAGHAHPGLLARRPAAMRPRGRCGHGPAHSDRLAQVARHPPLLPDPCRRRGHPRRLADLLDERVLQTGETSHHLRTSLMARVPRSSAPQPPARGGHLDSALLAKLPLAPEGAPAARGGHEDPSGIQGLRAEGPLPGRARPRPGSAEGLEGPAGPAALRQDAPARGLPAGDLERPSLPRAPREESLRCPRHPVCLADRPCEGTHGV
mmetsp:Transcript_106153/g.317097  ORF Transcript_106153/g.317097 Transcript_106153/m.317097 type:complete len:260 (+) Transcript_106153:2920-3699(+)